MSKNPEVRINFSWLFYYDISKKLNTLHDWDLSSGEKYEELTEAYRVAWADKEEAILSAMQEIIGLEFYKSVIDITTASDVIIAKLKKLYIKIAKKLEKKK